MPLPENGGRAGASLAEPEFCWLLADDFLGLEPFVSLDLELEFLRAEGIEVPLLWAEDFWALDLMFPAAVLWDGGVGAKCAWACGAASTVEVKCRVTAGVEAGGDLSCRIARSSSVALTLIHSC